MLNCAFRFLRLGIPLFAFCAQALGAEPSGVQAIDLTNTNAQLERRDQLVKEDDLRILIRAEELLDEPSAWNRRDDRECTDDESSGKRSLFCALQRACIDVLGAYEHRRVALQEVRFAVEDATQGQDLAHRMMDFNNLPSTQFTDIQAVLRIAKERVRQRLESAR